MKIRALLENSLDTNRVTLTTNDSSHSIQVAPKSSGYGSRANGGELLFLALAACYCNDIYREAEKQGVRVASVEVEVSGDFGAPGEPGTHLTYRTKVAAHATREVIEALIAHTDQLAEIHNTLRVGTPVALTGAEAVPL